VLSFMFNLEGLSPSALLSFSCGAPHPGTAARSERGHSCPQLAPKATALRPVP
jgi:hypothetical protein